MFTYITLVWILQFKCLIFTINYIIHNIIAIHDPCGKKRAIGGAIKGNYYEIPFGSLCSKKFNNLMACGKCMSSDHIAHSATRIQGSCILTVQAAGTAAALSSKLNVPACDVSVKALRETLKNNNVNLD